MTRPPPRAELFNVGWICALPIERAASEHILDEIYEDAREHFNVSYTLGRIEDHNVVIGCLPAGMVGTHSAAAVATRMEKDFPNIQIRLMVGVGGGVPGSQADIRLGDVVISQPQNGHGGVVQYGFGKSGVNQSFKSTGFLNAPPSFLLEAVTKLRSLHLRHQGGLTKHLATFDSLRDFTRLKAGADILFQPGSKHLETDRITGSSAGCDRCSQHEIIQRVARQDPYPVVHYGAIGSGTQVIKDGVTRDQRSRELGGILCFEMEAAGLMNTFPCLVVRGICDYADSHKNKHWQPYAAATAASCAKELLLLLNVATCVNVRSAGANTWMTSTMTPYAQRSENQFLQNSSQDLFKRLAFLQADARYETVQRAHAQTCQWFLDQPEYRAWLDPSQICDHHGFIWIKGKPGTGKSTLMKFLHERTRVHMQSSTVIRFFFNARGDDLERTTLGMYRSLLQQILVQIPSLMFVLESVVSIKSALRFEDDEHAVRDTLQRAIGSLEEHHLIFFVDALDECPEDDVRCMLELFEGLRQLAASRGTQILICFSSRHYPHVSINHGIELTLEAQSGHQHDLATYVQSKLQVPRDGSTIPIHNQILAKSSSIFLWVVLVIPMLQRAYDRGRVHALQALLDDIPADLENLFLDMCQRDSDNLDEMITCLQWILFARTPLRPEELYFGFLATVAPDQLEPWDRRKITLATMKRFIVNSSKGLAEVTKSDPPTVQFIHESVRDFLVHENGFGKIQSHLWQNSVGLGHEKLKQSCFTYITACSRRVLKIACENGIYSDRDLPMYPFIHYAVKQVFIHANEAHNHHISQQRFYENMPIEDWYWLFDAFHLYGVQSDNQRVGFLRWLATTAQAAALKFYVDSSDLVDIRDDRYRSILHSAMANGSRSTLKALLGLEIHGNQGSKDTKLSQIEEQVIDFLRHEDTRNDLKSSPHWSLLYWAIHRGHLEVAKLMIQSNMVDVNWKDPDEWTPLYLALKQGHSGIAELLITTGKIDFSFQPRDDEPLLALAPRNPRGQGSLLAAIINGNSKVVKALLQAGKTILCCHDHYGWTPLHWAASSGHEEVVKLLVDMGEFNTDDKDSFGWTPLQCAEAKGYEGIVEALMKAKQPPRNEGPAKKPKKTTFRLRHRLFPR